MCKIYSKNISAKTCLEKIKYILLIVFFYSVILKPGMKAGVTSASCLSVICYCNNNWLVY